MRPDDLGRCWGLAVETLRDYIVIGSSTHSICLLRAVAYHNRGIICVGLDNIHLLVILSHLVKGRPFRVGLVASSRW
jgi:hypothetical protein